MKFTVAVPKVCYVGYRIFHTIYKFYTAKYYSASVSEACPCSQWLKYSRI